MSYELLAAFMIIEQVLLIVAGLWWRGRVR